jgi:hypothetical protein
MKIEKLNNTIGWKIEPHTSEEYKDIEPKIEALMKEYGITNDKSDSILQHSDVQKAIDSLLADLDQNKERQG